MTKTEIIEIITQQYADMPEDSNIEGVILVTISQDGRSLFAHGEIDLSELYAALSAFNENTSD